MSDLCHLEMLNWLAGAPKINSQIGFILLTSQEKRNGIVKAQLKSYVDLFAFPVILLSTTALLSPGMKHGPVQFWFGFLQGSSLLKAISYPLIFSLVISPFGLIVQAALGFMYEPYVREGAAYS